MHPKAIPSDGRRRRGLGRGAAQPGRPLLRAGAEPARAPSARWTPGSTRSRSSCRRRTRTTARTSTARPRSRWTTSPRSSTWRTAAAPPARSSSRPPGAARTRATCRSSGCWRWPAARSRTAPTPCRTATPPAWPRPARVTRLVGETRSAFPDVALNLHFHNTRGTGPGQRPGRARARRQRLRRLGRRPRRLPLRARGDREHRHRGARAHGRGHGRRHRHRPRGDDRRGGRRPRRWSGAPCRPRCCGPGRAPGPWPDRAIRLVTTGCDMPDLSAATGAQ